MMHAVPDIIRFERRVAAMTLAALVAATLLVLAAPARAADTTPHQNYSWIDKNGERHYGDAVPPEYAQQERRVLNSQGVEVQHVDAEKNAQQQADDRKRQQAIEDKRSSTITSCSRRTHRRRTSSGCATSGSTRSTGRSRRRLPTSIRSTRA